MAIGKTPGGIEDLTFGMGTEQQQRQFGIAVITQINAGRIPYSATQSITDVVDPIKEGLDSHRLAENNPHKVTATQTGAAHEVHSHDIDDIDGLVSAFNAKVSRAGDNMTGRLDIRDTLQADHIQVDVQPSGDALIDFGNTAHIKFNTTDRDFTAKTPDGTDSKIWHENNFDAPGHQHDDAYYRKEEHITITDGISDAGKPIVLNAQGQVDASMIDVNSFYYVTSFTPTGGDEYPDNSQETSGAFWVVTDVDEALGYTFVGGDLAGQTIGNGDFMVSGSAGWSIMIGEMNPLLYYRLDGDLAITAPFAGGGQQLKSIADATDADDAVTLSQQIAGLSDQVSISGDTMTGDLTIGNGSTGEVLHIRGTGASNKPEVILHRQDDTVAASITWNEATNSLVMTSFDALGTTELSSIDVGTSVSMVNSTVSAGNDITDKDYVDGGDATVQGNLDTHISDDTNPHDVTQTQVGLGNVDNTSDVNKPVSTAQQNALDLKVDKAGDTMTGDLTVEGAVIVSDEFVTGIYPQTSNSVVIFTDTSGTVSGLPGLVWNNLLGMFQVDPGDGTNYVIWTAENFDPTDYVLFTEYSGHTNNTDNPHSVNKAQVGLGNADNTSDVNKPVSTDQQDALDNKYEIDYHVNVSSGSADAGKPVVLDNSGQLHPTITGQGMYPVAMFTPTAGDEYPDTTGESFGAYWGIEGLDPAGYLFLTGDLAGITLFNGDALIHGAQEWFYIMLNLDPDQFYRLDGSVAISHPFAGGTQRITNIGNAIEATDAVALGQVAPLLLAYLPRIGGIMTGDIDMSTANINFEDVGTGITGSDGTWLIETLAGGAVAVGNNAGLLYLDGSVAPEVRIGGVSQGAVWHAGNFNPADYLGVNATADNSQLLTNLTPALLPISTATQEALDTKLDADATAEDSLLLVGLTPAQQPISTATQEALDVKLDGVELETHLQDVANPHAVTKTQVGLSNVDNTSDANKPISDDTQSALNDKASQTDLTAHTGSTGNPHSVTAAQAGAPGGSWTWDGTTLAITIP